MLGMNALTTQHIGKFAARDNFNKFEKCQAPGFESLLWNQTFMMAGLFLLISEIKNHSDAKKSSFIRASHQRC